MYTSIDKILAQTDSIMVNAAEAHGIATGMLCINALIMADAWLQELFEANVELTEYDQMQLEALFAQTKAILNADDFTFDLLLPDDEAILAHRIDALKHWCLGFLSGVGFSSSSASWSEDSREILRDFIEFTRMDSDTEDETDEIALAELHQYIRVGVQLIRAAMFDTTSTNTLH